MSQTEQKAYCSRCSLPIFWAVLINGRKHPLNWIDDLKNQLTKDSRETGLTRGSICYSKTLNVFRIIKKEELTMFLRVGGSVAESHFETCRFADEFRPGGRK